MFAVRLWAARVEYVASTSLQSTCEKSAAVPERVKRACMLLVPWSCCRVLVHIAAAAWSEQSSLSDMERARPFGIHIRQARDTAEMRRGGCVRLRLLYHLHENPSLQDPDYVNHIRLLPLTSPRPFPASTRLPPPLARCRSSTSPHPSPTITSHHHPTHSVRVTLLIPLQKQPTNNRIPQSNQPNNPRPEPRNPPAHLPPRVLPVRPHAQHDRHDAHDRRIPKQDRLLRVPLDRVHGLPCLLLRGLCGALGLARRLALGAALLVRGLVGEALGLRVGLYLLRGVGRGDRGDVRGVDVDGRVDFVRGGVFEGRDGVRAAVRREWGVSGDMEGGREGGRGGELEGGVGWVTLLPGFALGRWRRCRRSWAW